VLHREREERALQQAKCAFDKYRSCTSHSAHIAAYIDFVFGVKGSYTRKHKQSGLYGLEHEL
jgi:hypothetical protein